MPAQAGIHVFRSARRQKRGWWAFVHHDAGCGEDQAVIVSFVVLILTLLFRPTGLFVSTVR